MSDRLPCRTPGCAAAILPATALKTGGICMPCHQKIVALEKKAYLLQNRKDVDRYAGVTDPVEILTIMHAPRTYNPLENELPYHKSARELYRQLTDSEKERLETYAIALMDEGDVDEAAAVLLSLVCYTNARIERGIDAYYHSGEYDPGILYKEAGPTIRDGLISLVDRDSTNRNELLVALAWIGDEEVSQLFAEWRRNPPQWASQLYIPPENYAHTAGWELDCGGRKRLLFHPQRYHFKVCGDGHGEEEPARSAVAALQKSDQVCPWCDAKLTVLLDCHLEDPLLRFMDLPGQRLRIATCMYCSCYGTICMKVDLDGAYSWSEYNHIPDCLPSESDPVEEQTWRTLVLMEGLMPTYDGADCSLEATTSHIGGHPAWIQDAEYPACCSCSDTMRFIGQVDMEQADDSEGIYYAFLCRDCLITAVHYQQT
ncbi:MULTISPECIES: DUF1963 domain-containing protein [Paenibacillus]|uniref:DUF1963 domain-containing protein n=1 Tax=Paenibacillus TaxID=44249 RepID=UPI0022B8A8DD|nr:DUF1963 domain-containing protein [Paenibacillus caseinilyticus]MCZ8521256.1 DUF1963 domain-containing protein [Paenibacillus caseinilyticus]